MLITSKYWRVKYNFTLTCNFAIFHKIVNQGIVFWEHIIILDFLGDADEHIRHWYAKGSWSAVWFMQQTSLGAAWH